MQYTGSTSSSTRDFAVDKDGPKEKKTVVKGQLGKQKFGVQATKPRVIQVFRNGDKHHKGEQVTIKATFRTYQQLIDEFTKVVRLTTGPVKKVVKADCKTLVKTLDDFEDGGKYLCCGAEKIDMAKLPGAFAA